jgi:hypothetical protein
MLRLTAFAVLVSFLTLGCGNQATVGTGEPFSSLPAQPSGYEMWLALKSIIDDTTSDLLPFGRTNGRETNISPRLQSEEEQTDQFDCDPTGKITSKISETENSVAFETQFENCAGEMAFNLDQTYSESLNGNSEFRLQGNEMGIGLEHWTIQVNLSASGDIGFAVNCDMSMDADFCFDCNPDPPENVQGECKFIDSEGTIITMTLQELIDSRGVY